MFSEYALSLVIWLPVIGGIVVLATGSDKNAPVARVLALLVSLLTLVASIPLYTEFNNATVGMQFLEYIPWIAHAFEDPIVVKAGNYQRPELPGAGTTPKPEAVSRYSKKI